VLTFESILSIPGELEIIGNKKIKATAAKTINDIK
jgi:hypothetical protein